MKRFTALFLIAFMILFLTACQKSNIQTTFEVNIGGETAVLEHQPDSKSKGTVTLNDEVYSYEYFNNGDLEITYPDGCIYSERNLMAGSVFASASSFKNPYGQEIPDTGKVPGADIADAIESISEPLKEGESPAIYVLISVIGILCTVFARGVWSLIYGIRYKDAEPGEGILFLIRAVGVISAAFGILSILF